MDLKGKAFSASRGHSRASENHQCHCWYLISDLIGWTWNLEVHDVDVTRSSAHLWGEREGMGSSDWCWKQSLLDRGPGSAKMRTWLWLADKKAQSFTFHQWQRAHHEIITVTVQSRHYARLVSYCEALRKNLSGDFFRLCLCSNFTFFSLTTRTRRFSETRTDSALLQAPSTPRSLSSTSQIKLGSGLEDTTNSLIRTYSNFGQAWPIISSQT